MVNVILITDKQMPKIEFLRKGRVNNLNELNILNLIGQKIITLLTKDDGMTQKVTYKLLISKAVGSNLG